METITSYSSIMCPYHAEVTCSGNKNTLPECIKCDWNKQYSVTIGGWQTCPKCFGQGLVWFPPNYPMNPTFTNDGRPYECDICNGKKIIDITTGKPPK